jgi:peptidoglycan/xylan/chitin deacetylase (PgdA/CDA1 family)
VPVNFTPPRGVLRRARAATIRVGAAVLVAVMVVVTGTANGGRQPAVPREVAVTFDDLPAASVTRRGSDAWRAITTRLLAAIARHRVPAVGFVIEGKLAGDDGTVDRDRVALLRQWLDAGLDLGNHSVSHRDLNLTPLEAFEEDVLRGERVTRPLVEAHGRTLTFFRHPMLHTGETLEKKQAFEQFLAAHGYRVAPVTIDNDDYLFAAALDRAEARRDRAVMRRVEDAYVPYMDAKIAYYEQQAAALFGREIRQILLLHANSINARRFDALATAIERRGYRFVALERALEDPAYQSPDTYTGTGGITWIHRWAITRGVPKTFFRGEPDVPAFVADAARAPSRH